jgi:uncharacterized protein YegL
MGMRWAIKNKLKSIKWSGKNDRVLSVVLIIILIFLSSQIILITSGLAPGSKNSRSDSQPDIEYLIINTIIDNNYAVTNIQQKFKNPNNYPIDETFQFQVPTKAFISNFSLTINDKVNYAQIVSRSVGKEKYNKAVISGSNAGLVEAEDKNIFTYSVSLSPFSETIVGLRYEQFLEKSIGGYEYIIPLKNSDVGSNIKNFSIDITVKSKLIVTDLRVESHHDKSNVSYVSDNEVKISYMTTSSTPNHDFTINYGLSSPPVNGTMLNYNDGTEEYFLHIFSPQRSDLGGQAMPKEIIFVLDKSGSMSGDKIEQLKTAFKEIINQLRPTDSFNIIMFDNKITKYKSELIGVSSKNKSETVEYINDIGAGGSTNINEALETALDMFTISETKMPIIVMLTDGLPTAGVTNTKTIRENIKNKNIAKVSLFCLGFGFDVDFEFLKAMSLENYGHAIRIYEKEDASEQITDFYDTISTPLLRSLTFSYSDGAYEFYPKYVEQLFEGTEIVVVGKYNGTSRKITSTVTAMSSKGMKTFRETFYLEDSYKLSFDSQVLFSKDNDNLEHKITTSEPEHWDGVNKLKKSYDLRESMNNSFIPRFWAYAKIRYLLDNITVFGEVDYLVENVTDLALTYGFVTPYTSLLVEISDDEPTHEPPPDPFDDGSDSYDYGGSEGEAESESESESESEFEAILPATKVNDGVESTIFRIEDPSEAEAMIKIPDYNLKPKLEGNAEFNHKPKVQNDSETDDDPNPEIDLELVIEQEKNICLTVSITNNNENQCNVYWLGLHFNWQPDNIYFICTDINIKNSLSIEPGETEYFYINFEIPGDVQTDNQSYDILFQYELQDGWFGGWNDYKWQSKTNTDLKVNEKDTNNNDVFIDEDGKLKYPSPMIPSVLNQESITTEDNDNNDEHSLPLDPVGNDGAGRDNFMDKDGENVRTDILNSNQQKKDDYDEEKDFEIVNIYLYVTLGILIAFLFVLFSIIILKNRKKNENVFLH